MKKTITNVFKTILQICFVIGVLAGIYIILDSCEKKEDNLPVLNICNNDIDIQDYYDNGYEWGRLERDINEICNLEEE